MISRPRWRVALVVGCVIVGILGTALPRPATGAAVDNGRIHAETGDSIGPWGANAFFPRFGPGLLDLWFPDWYPFSGSNLPGDVMWYGTYDYVATAPSGTSSLAYWEQPDSPSNGTVEGEPGPGKWADDHTSTPLSGGVETVIDATTFEISWSEARATGASFDTVLNYHALPNQRTIRVIATITNTDAATDFDFAFYHAEDVDAGGVPGADNDANNDGNDALDNAPPFDTSNSADDGVGDPADTWDESIIPYTGVSWYTGWPGTAVATSGWKGPGVGYVTVTDAGGQDVCDQTIAPANCAGAPDGRPDLYSGLSSFDPGIDWYVGRWDAAAYGPGLYQPAFLFPPPLIDTLCIDPVDTMPPPGFDANLAYATYWTWEDIFECDASYQDSPGHPLVNGDNGVGLLKDFETIPATESRSFTFYIGEPPVGTDIAIANSDITVWPHIGSTVVGTTQSLNVTVHSGGTLDVSTDFDVSFYKDDPDGDDDGLIDSGASLIGTVTVPAGSAPLAPGDTYTATLPWTPVTGDIGQFTIYAAADYQATGPFIDGFVNEVDLPFYEITNNKAFYDTASIPPGPIPLRTAPPPDYEVHPLPVPPRPQPPRELVTAVSGPDINVSWLPPIGSGADYYLLYRGATPRGLDLVTPIGQTVGNETTWTDVGAASMPEVYYVARSFNTTLSEASSTSNTAGAFMIAFELGLNSFSLPLRPFTAEDTAMLYAELGSIDLQYMDAGGAWRVYPGAPSVPVGVGQGYLANFAAATNHTFVGHPGSMISYEGGTYGFNAAEATSLWAMVTPSGDVVLNWVEPTSPLVGYCVFRSPTRPGFHDGTAVLIGCTSGPTDTTWTDPGVAAVPGEWYYMVFPPAGTPFGTGTSTYSVGVWTAGYSGAHALGLPLRPAATQSVDWYTADLPNVLGMDWFSAGSWRPHFQEMPAGVYDAPFLQGQGAQIQVASAGRYSFVGT